MTLFEPQSVTQCHENYKKLDILSLARPDKALFFAGLVGGGGRGGEGIIDHRVPKVSRRHFVLHAGALLQIENKAIVEGGDVAENTGKTQHFPYF